MIEFELRARDLERASRTDPSILDRQELLGLMIDETWSVRMHLCRMFPRISWPPDEYRQVVDFAFAQAVDKNAFVRAWALDALATFACTDEAIRSRVSTMITEALESDLPAVRVRAREGLKRVNG